MNAADTEPRGPIALETQEISKHFGAVKAVDQLSMAINRKGMTSIIGPNGSGKSTLVSCIRSSLHYSKVSEKIGNRILARTGETD